MGQIRRPQQRVYRCACDGFTNRHPNQIGRQI
jgi:hypothetical protein